MEIYYLARMFHALLSRDREDGRTTGQPSRATAGLDPKRTWAVRRRVSLSWARRQVLSKEHPMTDISTVAVMPGREFMKHPG